MAAIYVPGIQGALPMEPLLSNAQIGGVVLNNTHTIIEGRTSSYRSSNMLMTDNITIPST